jgi:ribosomal protein S27E
MASTQEVINTKWWRKPMAIQISNCKHMTYVFSESPLHVPCAN